VCVCWCGCSGTHFFNFLSLSLTTCCYFCCPACFGAVWLVFYLHTCVSMHTLLIKWVLQSILARRVFKNNIYNFQFNWFDIYEPSYNRKISYWVPKKLYYLGYRLRSTLPYKRYIQNFSASFFNLAPSTVNNSHLQSIPSVISCFFKTAPCKT